MPKFDPVSYVNVTNRVQVGLTAAAVAITRWQVVVQKSIADSFCSTADDHARCAAIGRVPSPVPRLSKPDLQPSPLDFLRRRSVGYGPVSPSPRPIPRHRFQSAGR